jgi:phosphoglucosamine mutase
MVDASGRLYNGDEVLYLMVADRLARDEAVPGVVGTLMTNMAVEVALKAKGVQFVRAKVGDRYVLEELKSTAGCWAARARATCWRWTSTPPAMA